MVNPVQFDFVDPSAAILNGIKMGGDLALIDQKAATQQAQQQKALMEQQQLLQQHADVQSLLMNPNASHSDYAGLILKYPKLAEPGAKAFELMDKDRQRNLLNATSRVYGALSSGNTQVAGTLLRDRANAAKASGDADEFRNMTMLADLVEKGGPEGARTAQFMLSGALAGMVGPEKFGSTLADLRKTERDQELQPSAVRKSEAEAAKAEIEAAAAPGQIALTDAQRRQATAMVEKLDAETRKTLAEVNGSGSLDPTKQFQLESELRKEYANRTQAFQDMRESYRRIEASKDDAAGDLSLIFAFMKMLDPASVVREGEFANAQNAAGVPDRILNIYNKVLRGERLTPGQRSTFKGQALSLLKSAEPREKQVREGIGAIAKSYRLNPDNIFFPQTGRREDSPERSKLRSGVQSLLDEYGR